MVKILQGSVVTQTTLGGLTTYSRVANFLHCIRAKNYDNWLTVDKVIAKIIRLTFLAHPVHDCHLGCNRRIGSCKNGPQSYYRSAWWQLPKSTLCSWRVTTTSSDDSWQRSGTVSWSHDRQRMVDPFDYDDDDDDVDLEAHPLLIRNLGPETSAAGVGLVLGNL